MKKLLFIVLSMQMLFALGIKELKVNDSVEESIEKMEKHIYKVTVPKNRSVHVKLSDLTADLDIYVKAHNIPTLRVNDCSSANSKLENETCILNNNDKKSDYYILVYGFKEGNYKLSVSINELDKIELLKRKRVSIKNTDAYVNLNAYHQAKYKIKLKYATLGYFNFSNIYITTNGHILTFTYTVGSHQYIGSINLMTLEFIDSVQITYLNVNSPASYHRTGNHLNLFYTIHSTPEKGLYHYYHVADNGVITKIEGINPGGLDSNFIWKQGTIDNDKYYITYLEEHISGGIQYLKYTKKIYNVSNLPNMPLIDTIITLVEIPI